MVSITDTIVPTDQDARFEQFGKRGIVGRFRHGAERTYFTDIREVAGE